MEGRRICRTARNLRERKQSPARQRWGTALARFYVPVARRIMLRMTRHKHAHTGLVTPQLPQLWLTAALRAFAMLVLHVASTLQMIRRGLPVNATRAMPADLPREMSDTHQQETHEAAQHRSPLALILRIAKRSSRRSERRSAKRTNWSGGPIRAANAGAIAKAGVLTATSHTHHGSGPPVRVPREGGDPVLLKQEAPGIPTRHSGFPPSRETRRSGLKT